MMNPVAEARIIEQTRPSGRLVAQALFFLGLLCLLLVLSHRLLGDPDTYWHLAVGRSIWEGAAFPHADALSHTFAGQPWIAKEWLAQIVLYAAEAAGGWRGVALLTAVTASASFALLFGFLLRRLPPVAALALVTVAIVPSAGQILARPQVFFFLLLTVWTCALVEAVERKARPPFWLVPVLVIWANMHASFTFAFVVAGCLGLEALAAATPQERRRTFLGWALFGAASMAAIVLTPYGYEPALIAFRVFGSGEAIRYISEWQPLGFDGRGAAAAAGALAALAVLASRPRQYLFRLCLAALCAYLMFRHQRFGSLFGIEAAILTATPVARLIGRSPAGHPMPRNGMSAAAFAGLVTLCATSLAAAILVDPRPSPRMAPARALMAARDAGVAGPVYNDYDFGGYLISQGVPTFVDGRSDQLFVGGFLSGLHAAIDADDPQPFLSFIGRYGVTWALVRPGSRESEILAGSPDWREIHRDETAAVFSRLPGGAARNGGIGLNPVFTAVMKAWRA